MQNKHLLLGIGLLLICIGVFKPNLPSLGLSRPNNSVVAVNVDKPTDPALLALAQELVSSVRQSKVTREDGIRVASLCFDMSTLVGLSGSSEIIRNTEEVRQANRLSGLMARIDMNKKYPDLAAKMNAMVIGYIGDDIVVLTSDTRSKAVNVFQALAWAFNEGSK